MASRLRIMVIIRRIMTRMGRAVLRVDCGVEVEVRK